MCISIYISICLSICPFVCLSVCLYVSMYICMYVRLSIGRCFCLSLYTFTCVCRKKLYIFRSYVEHFDVKLEHVVRERCWNYVKIARANTICGFENSDLKYSKFLGLIL